MLQRYSFFSLARRALAGHRGWRQAWRSPDPKPSYDVIIIGGGGHGLATAYFLAKAHGIRNVAVLEKGWIGGGNSGRNTQVVRSNYFYPESAAFYERSRSLYERLSRELNFNLMFSQRGMLVLAHSDHELEMQRRWLNAILLNGIECELLTPAQIRSIEPLVELNGRYPVVGGFIQRSGGIARHDAVNWGFARAADGLGVDIIQDCAVTGFKVDGNRVMSVQTSRGNFSAGRVGIAVAGHSSVLARMAGFRLPLTSMALQAMVTEPVKPALNTVLMSDMLHVYVSQSDRGEIVLGGAADGYNSYAQRGSFGTIEDNAAALLALVPRLSRLKLMRQWAGIVDISPDTTPILGKTPLHNLYINAGWGTGGFKAIPAGGETFAWTIANDRPHPLVEAFTLERFAAGALIDETAASAVAH